MNEANAAMEWSAHRFAELLFFSSSLLLSLKDKQSTMKAKLECFHLVDLLSFSFFI